MRFLNLEITSSLHSLPPVIIQEVKLLERLSLVVFASRKHLPLLPTQLVFFFFFANLSLQDSVIYFYLVHSVD